MEKWYLAKTALIAAIKSEPPNPARRVPSRELANAANIATNAYNEMVHAAVGDAAINITASALLFSVYEDTRRKES
jgi:hypothetical protein